MISSQLIFSLLLGGVIASPIETRAGDSRMAQIVSAANILKYAKPDLNRDITEWLAIGDSFAARITEDHQSDELNSYCSRYKMSYPNQMNQNPRFPGHSTSRKFIFGACSGGTMQDVIDKQLEAGNPDLNADYPKIGKPQIGTLSISGNDLGFGDIVNGCIYHWHGAKDCSTQLREAHNKLDDPGKAFFWEVVSTISRILAKARSGNNPNFQLYLTGYVEFWNEHNTQCDTIDWTPWYRENAYLTTTLRADMNQLVRKLNALLKKAIEDLSLLEEGVYYVDGWQSKYDGHRFCEQENDPNYHKKPVAERTWFIHYETDFPSISAIGNGASFFDVVDTMLIPVKDGKSTVDQIKAVNGDVSKINPAYKDSASMNAALTKLANDDHTLSWIPVTWSRVMHPKGSGYTVMSDSAIDSILQFGAQGVNAPPQAPAPKREKTCVSGNNKFMNRDDMTSQIGKFCTEAAKQRVQDSGSGSIGRKYNVGSRYEISLSMDWPSGLDITKDMEANCNNFMTQLVDDCGGNDPKNPLNWKHGGTFQVDQVKYNVIPEVDQKYTPGTCTFHLQEDEKWLGVDGPGTERHFTFHIEKGTLKDGAGTVIATTGFARNGKDGVEIEAGDKNPLRFNSALPNPIVITPEAGGKPKDYVQFSVGDQSWTTTQSAGMPYCNTGGWSSDYSPANRNMDCFFHC